MSSSGSGSNTPDFSNSDLDLKKGFALVGIVLLFLCCLVVCRFGCNLCIDVVILRDNGSLIRALSEIRRWFFPRWHPRVVIVDLPTTTTPASSPGPEAELELVNMDRLLSGLTPKQKQELLASILTSKIASEQDMEDWKAQCEHTPVIPHGNEAEQEDKEELTEIASSSQAGIICPICIHDIDIGNHVVLLSACDHMFHRDCLSQWLSTHTRDCPYCRTEIITQEMLDEAYRIRNNSTSNPQQ